MLYFPAEVTSSNLIDRLQQPCKDAGFNVAKKKVEKIKQEGVRRKHVIGCSKSIKYRNRSKVRKTDTDTTKPTNNEHLCGTWFPVFERDDGRLFLRKNGDCCWEHNHPAIDSELLREGVRDVPEATLETAKKLLELGNISTAMVGEFVAMESGVKLSEDSLQRLKSQVSMSKFGTEGTDSSAGQKLVHMLEERDDCDFIMLTGSYDEATNLVRVTKKRRTKVKGKQTIHDQSTVTDLDDQAEDHVKNVVKGLDLGNNEYLIAIAWCTEEQKLHHKKFPFVLGYDETFRTNAEKRPLASLCGMSMDNKLLCFVEAFLPSKQKWVFNWLWKVAYPTLLDRPALKKTAIVLVDQDENNWTAMSVNLKSQDAVYGDGEGRLCNWHKVRMNTSFVC